MEQVTFGSGGGSGATGHVRDPQQEYISKLLNQSMGHGGGHDSFASSGGGHGGAKKPNPLVQLAVLGLGAFAAFRFGLHRKLLDSQLLKKGPLKRVGDFLANLGKKGAKEAPKLAEVVAK